MATSTRPPSQLRQALLIGLLLALVFGGLVFAVHRLLAENTLGIDLFVFWSSGRALLMDGLSPYDPVVNQQVQMAIFGRLAQPGEDPMLYAFPPYGLLPVLPLLPLPFDWAQAVWLVFYLLAACSLPYLLFPRAPRWLVLTLPVLYPVTFAIILGNYVFLIGLVLLLACGLVLMQPEPARRWQIATGILLAWTTIKPQFVWLYLVFAALYALRWRRWAFAASFGAALGTMLAISWLVVPTWAEDWLSQVRDYAQVNQVVSNSQSFLGMVLPETWLGPANLFSLGLFLAATAWIFYRWWRGQVSLLPTLAWIGLVTNLFDPRAISYEQITLVVPFFLWAATQTQVADRAATQLRGIAGPIIIGSVWLTAIVLTWGFFAVAKSGIYPLATEQGPILAYSLWFGLAFIRRRPNRSNQTPVI